MDQRTGKDLLDAHEREERAKRSRVRYVPGGMKTIVIAGAIILVALVVWFIRPTATGQRPNFGGANQATPVGVAKAVSGDIRVTLNALGTVSPLATAVGKPQVAGQLIKVNF